MNYKFVFLFKIILINKTNGLKQSILFYPIVFVIGSIILFLITSNIDKVLYEQINFNVPYIDSLIFTGSADASRSILSAIAGGWATILGITFSVTLVTLQLSSTKYTSHIVNKFEEDRINQLTLGLFILVVLYSMMVLKTVRTGSETNIFTPIIGVNVAVILAIIALFTLVLFLNNISSYLKPNILVFNIVQQIIISIRSLEKRQKYDKKLDDKLCQDKRLFELKSVQKRNLQFHKFGKNISCPSKIFENT